MRLIALTQDQFAMVDDADYAWAVQFTWAADRRVRASGVVDFYAVRTVKIDGKDRKIYLHRALLGVPDGRLTDHEDGNGLNCQRTNIRACSHADNSRNKRTRPSRKYKGTHPSRNHIGEWVASIKVDRRKIHLGTFASEELAARAYDAAARQYFGAFANLNFGES